MMGRLSCEASTRSRVSAKRKVGRFDYLLDGLPCLNLDGTEGPLQQKG